MYALSIPSMGPFSPFLLLVVFPLSIFFLLFFTYCYLQWYSHLSDPFNQYPNYLHSSSGGLKLVVTQIDFYHTSLKEVRKYLSGSGLAFSSANNLTDMNLSTNFTYCSSQVLVTVHHNLKVLGFFTWLNCYRVQCKNDLSH